LGAATFFATAGFAAGLAVAFFTATFLTAAFLGAAFVAGLAFFFAAVFLAGYALTALASVRGEAGMKLSMEVALSAGVEVFSSMMYVLWDGLNYV
jgi:hypothetical protein